MSDIIKYLAIVVLILVLDSVVASAIVAYNVGTVSDPSRYGFDIPGWQRAVNNTTVTATNFTDPGVSTTDIGLTSIYGAWSMDSQNGVYPTALTNRAWLGWLTGDQYEACCAFGDVAVINGTWSETYTFNNVAFNEGDYVKVLINAYTQTTNTQLYYLVMNGHHVYLENYGYSLQVGNYFGGTWNSNFTQAYANAVNGGGVPALYATKMSDSILDNYYVPSGSVKLSYTLYMSNFTMLIYVNDQLVDSFFNEYLFSTFMSAQNAHRQAIVVTNIAPPVEAYHLSILSNYQSLTVTNPVIYGSVGDNMEYNGYGDIWNLIEILGQVLIWPVDSGATAIIPKALLFVFIGIPELLLLVIGYMLVRGVG